MKKLLLTFAVLLCCAPIARAQPTEAQNSWQAIIESNNVKGAEVWVAEPEFDPLLKLPRYDSSLLGAALQKKRAAIATILIHNAKTDAYLRDSDALYSLAKSGNASVLKLYLAQPKFDANQLVGDDSLLFQAVSGGNIEGAKLLLADKHVKPAGRNKDGKTALFAVANSRSEPLTALLLADKRIDPNAVDKNGDTALHVNADYGDANVLKRLVSDSRVNPNLKNKKAQTPLFLAASSDMALVKVLVANKKVVVGPKEKAQIAKLKKAGGFIGGMGNAG